MNKAKRADELAAARDKIERLNRLYATLSRINRAIVRFDGPSELYDAVCRIAVDSGAFGFACIGLAEPDGGVKSVARAGAAAQLDHLVMASAAAADGNPAALAIGEGRPCIVNDVASGDAPWRRALAEIGMRSVAAFPLRVNGAVTGAVIMAAGEADYFKDAETHLLAEVADDISFALTTMRREEQRLAAETKIEYLAYYDTETGLPGRVRFAERIAVACAAAAGTELPVLAVTLRRYHAVLQALGQRAGAGLAQVVVARLESLLPTAPVARISESEFAVLAEGVEGLHLVEELTWRIHAALAAAIPTEGGEVFLDPFVGIALCPRDGGPAETIRAALLAAGQGPADASNYCRFFVADMDSASRRKLDLEAALRRALENEEFVLHYQPQLDLARGTVVGAEALLRWRRADGGLVSPGELIPLLEETGLIVAVGAWVLKTACRTAKRWQDEGLPPLRMAVNLSARQFRDGDIGTVVRCALETSQLEPRWLELEITESMVLLDAEAAIRVMNEVRSLGVGHALDDFGTGYSSLSYLRRLSLTRIKIDQSFVTHITASPEDAAIVRAVVGMAHSLGLAVVAEGVETEGQLGFLRGLQCEEMQGYYFSRAVPAEDFAALLRAGRGLPLAEQRLERTLLIVDDEPNVLSALRRLLRTEFRVLATLSVKEGFDLLAAHSVGVVVCDQRMPEMTGTEFLRRAKELHPGVVRVVLSGYTELNSVIDAVNRGAVFKFITKPWDDGVLVESLRDAFRFHEMETQNRALSREVAELKASRG